MFGCRRATSLVAVRGRAQGAVHRERHRAQCQLQQSRPAIEVSSSAGPCHPAAVLRSSATTCGINILHRRGAARTGSKGHLRPSRASRTKSSTKSRFSHATPLDAVRGRAQEMVRLRRHHRVECRGRQSLRAMKVSSSAGPRPPTSECRLRSTMYSIDTSHRLRGTVQETLPALPRPSWT